MAAPRQPILQAVLEAIGGEDDAIGGQLSTQLSDPLLRADATALVETTIGFRTAGKLACEGEVMTYAGVTPTTFTGLARGQPGRNGAQTLPADHPRIATPVFDLSRQHSALDRLRRAIVLDYAEERDLDRIGRNFGLPRPKLLLGDDTNYREYLRIRAYGTATTLQHVRAVLAALIHGRWNFAAYEDPRRPGELFVDFSNVPGLSKLAWKTFSNGSEAQTATGFSTVTVDFAARNVQGVWLATDVERVGRNYWNLVNENAIVDSAEPGVIRIPSGLVAADAGRVVQLRGGTQALTDGDFYRIDSVDLNLNRVSVHALTLGTTAPDGAPVDPVDGAAPAWVADEAGVEAEIFSGGTFISRNLTLRGLLPAANAAVVVDYGAVRSAQVLRNESIVNDRSPARRYWPFYLGDGGASAICAIVDDLLAAGIVSNCRIR